MTEKGDLEMRILTAEERIEMKQEKGRRKDMLMRKKEKR